MHIQATYILIYNVYMYFWHADHAMPILCLSIKKLESLFSSVAIHHVDTPLLPAAHK